MLNYILTSDGELMHYGVPGMRWGKRKARPVMSLDGSKKRAAVKDKKKANVNKKERAIKVASKVANIGSKIAVASLTDDIFYGGKGKKLLKNTGRAAVTTYLKKFKGSTSVTWYD